MPFVVLGVAEALVFFRTPRHFFIIDTLNWMAFRYRSLGEFLAGFTQADPAFWYRPLSQRTVESLLFPLVRFNPLPYRVVGFFLFFSCTIALYVLAKTLTENRRLAWLSVLLFTPHLINAFPTYDVAFTPELMFTLFLIGSATFYVRYLKTKERSAVIVSSLLFAGSLLSKETAVALPFLLLTIWAVLPRTDRGSIRSVLPHFAILAVYLALVVGYVHVRHVDINSLLRGDTPSKDEYKFSIGRHALTNLDMALNWSAGFSKGVYGYWELSSHRRLLFLKAFSAAICIGAVCVLFTSGRWILLLGIAWFLFTVGPALLLEGHFLPYYLFAPLVGFAIAAGSIMDWAYSQGSKISHLAATVVTVLVLAAWGQIHAGTANRLAANSVTLGEAARVSGIAYRDVLAAYPRIPEGSRLVLFNEDIRPRALETEGELFRLAYDDPSLITDYFTAGFSFPLENPDTDKIIAFKWVDDHFVDVTSFVRQRPELLRPHEDSAHYHPGLRREKETYTLRVPELANEIAVVLYAINGHIMEPLRVPLNNQGEGTFAPVENKPGTYTLVAVRRENESAWVIVGRSIRAR